VACHHAKHWTLICAIGLRDKNQANFSHEGMVKADHPLKSIKSSWLLTLF